ncbi:unnamed protein product [Bursaphelenchus okinawaensis]|uniref:Uncharacterized protein n=1 Tax=Bursaphelenchus okinawaensis TaxID=465554 RepID=A0A811L9H0_9BILA|nr:unnamed protein product [Bursaphelenchus okinawaensis]CAG9120381.1 unnamed protein product [Bursaphelenchus okinawaensis]
MKSWLFIHLPLLLLSILSIDASANRTRQGQEAEADMLLFRWCIGLAVLAFVSFLCLLGMLIFEECTYANHVESERPNTSVAVTSTPSSISTSSIRQRKTDPVEQSSANQSESASTPHEVRIDIQPRSQRPTVCDSRIYMWPRRKRAEVRAGEAINRLLREMENKLSELKEEHKSMDMAFAENLHQNQNDVYDTTPLRSFVSSDDERLKTCVTGDTQVEDEQLHSADSMDVTQASVTQRSVDRP